MKERTTSDILREVLSEWQKDGCFHYGGPDGRPDPDLKRVEFIRRDEMESRAAINAIAAAYAESGLKISMQAGDPPHQDIFLITIQAVSSN